MKEFLPGKLNIVGQETNPDLTSDKLGIYELSYRGLGFNFDSQTRKIRSVGKIVLLKEDRSELLTSLVLAGGCVPRDELCAEFWKDTSLEVAIGRLSNLIFYTRKDLGGLRKDLIHSLGYAEARKKVVWNVIGV